MREPTWTGAAVAEAAYDAATGVPGAAEDSDGGVVVMDTIAVARGESFQGESLISMRESFTLSHPLGVLLDSPCARGAFLLRVTMSPPWSVRVQDRAPLTSSLRRLAASFIPDGGDPVPLAEGDVLLVLGPEPYVVADRADTAPLAVIHPGQRCETPDGRARASMRQGIRTWATPSTAPRGC